jgi:putative ABC transport system permease protein
MPWRKAGDLVSSLCEPFLAGCPPGTARIPAQPEQTRDIGVRMALGATPGRVRADVLRRALLVCLAGAVVGMGLALATSRVIASLLFEVSPTDPLALIGACALLLAVAAIAAYVPASHASRVDPARALQAD